MMAGARELLTDGTSTYAVSHDPATDPWAALS